MDIAKLIITAHDVDVKSVNKLLLSLRQWQLNMESSWDNCQILRSKADVSKDPTTISLDKPPLIEYHPTEFMDMTLPELESFMLVEHRDGVETNLFLLLDDQGVKDETIVVVDRRVNLDEATMFDEDAPLYLDVYEKVRVPWMEAESLHGNLALANMDMEEFCEDNSMDSEGWYAYKGILPPSRYEEVIEKRDAVLRELAKLDLA